MLCPILEITVLDSFDPSLLELY